MPEVRQKDDGTEETIYTQEEVDNRLKEKDDFVAAKLEEFKKGKTAQELKDAERDGTIAAIQKKAEDAMQIANTTVKNAQTKVKNFIAGQIVGEDKDLRTKLDSNYEIVEAGRVAKGLDVTSDEAINEMLTQAAGMAGIPITSTPSPQFPLVNGMAPNFNKSPDEISDADHNEFLKATGQEIPKKEEKK